MILVTGASGKTGRAVIRALVARGAAVRALAHRAEQVPALEALGAREVLVGDMRLPSAMARAMHGIQSVYHICPNVSRHEEVMGRVALEAAQAANLERFVYHSVLHPQIEAMPHHWLKLRVEERLLASGLDFTILQPATYMQNVLAYWQRIAGEGVYPVPYAVETRLDMVDLEDVAEAAAIVLTEPGHRGATYELASGVALSQDQVAAVLSNHLGRPVRAEAVSRADWERDALAAGASPYAVRTLLAMFTWYERHGFHGNGHVLAWLLGRRLASFDAFASREAHRRRARAAETS